MSLTRVLWFHLCRRHPSSTVSGGTAQSEECRQYTLAAEHSTTRLALETPPWRIEDRYPDFDLQTGLLTGGHGSTGGRGCNRICVGE
jgi:hypothetical protein